MLSKYKIEQSKYKIGLLRGNLLLAALLLALLAPADDDVGSALLLWLAAGWLGVTAALLEFSHRRPPLIPWQLLPSLLLIGMLWSAPQSHLLWFWAWAVLIMLPQPGWMTALNALLATLSWWSLTTRLPLEQMLTAGLVLAGLMTLGLARLQGLQQLHGQARHRMRLIPGLRLWPGEQLASDLSRERARTQREGGYAELILLRSPRHQLWSLAHQLCDLTHRFECCYRVDGKTLAALLLSRDASHAEARREHFLQILGSTAIYRATALSRVESLAAERRALNGQRDATFILRESADA